MCLVGFLCLGIICCQQENIPDTTCTDNSFLINLEASACLEDIQTLLTVASLYEENIETKRLIEVNGIPNHPVGKFPNRGNPNAIALVAQNFSMETNPNTANMTTSGQGYTFGVLFSGVTLDPYTAEFFTSSSGQINRNWNITALTSTYDLGLDCNNGHVQPTGKYHYHGTPSAMLAALDNGGVEMIRVGFAADGFPIYYKYAHVNGSLQAVQSGYQLKKGFRPGDGNIAPDGCYDGTYFQDYEFVENLSPLDACNGMLGKTPASDEEYFYLITDNFPSSPLCFTGTPDASFRNQPNRNDSQGHHHILFYPSALTE